jgi:hypothetical protein
MSAVTRRILRRTVIAGMTAVLLQACGAFATREAREVRDPHYGEVLFYFYHQKYFSALGHLMTAQHFGRTAQHADEAELLRGGMLLSYGVHLEAGRIFERLIAEGAPPAVRDRAWFYLAKIRYQRGYLDEAEDAIGRIENRLPGELEDERQILHAFLLMRREKYAEAVERLRRLDSRSDWARYGQYNLGIALIRAGETRRGTALLEQIGRGPASGEEFKALRDKANVAIGFTFLQGEKPDPARAALERVRLEGLMSNKALLGMGWAHSAQDRNEKALVHWNELRNRSLQDGAVLESLLASPFALGKLGVWRRALEQYEQAIAVYGQETARLDESIAAIRGGRLVESLLQQDTREEMGWFWKLERLPDAPETRYLALLLASHAFQEALKNYRDLRFLTGRLDQWAGDLEIYDDMLATRRRGFTERLPAVMNSRHEQDVARLKAERDRLSAVVTRIEAENDGEALASARERGQLDRLERIRTQLAKQAGDVDTQDRHRLLRGLLRWDIETGMSARLWEANKSLQALDRALGETGRHRAALNMAREQTPGEFQAFETRIRALAPRIRGLQDRARELERAQTAHLAELAVTELDAQRERIATYLTQARFAVAQIYDRSTSQSPPEAP